MTDKQVIKDLRSWSDQKLALWFRDVVSRFEMADQSHYNAYGEAVSLLIDATVRMLATKSSVPADEIGREIARSIGRYRSRKQKKA